MIKNFLFDMGGVVFLQDTEEAFSRFRKTGINPDDYMGAYGQKDFFLDVETGKINAEEFCRRMSDVTGRTVSYEEAQQCWLGFIKEVPVSRLHKLLSLRQHYHVCLLSNTNPFIMDFTRSDKFSAEGKPINHYFDTLFCSYEMHAYKPEAEIFMKALEHDGMKAAETVFVDDSRKNICAAEALGIKGLLVPPDHDWADMLDAMLSENA